MDRFPSCLAETLKWEGGWSNDPVDPGGATMKGIIQVEYNAYRQHHGLAPASVRGITNAELLDIYRPNYWVPMRCEDMPVGLDLLTFDFAVNSGVGQAVKSLQRVLGLTIDGHLGGITMNAVAQAAPLQLIRAYMEERRRFLRNLKTFWHFGAGWMDRCDGVEAAALSAVTKSPPMFEAAGELPMPLADADAQSAQIGKAPAEPTKQPVTAQASAAAGGTLTFFAAAPEIMAKATQGGKLTIAALIVAVLSSPWFWAGAGSLFAAIFYWLHRRKANA